MARNDAPLDPDMPAQELRLHMGELSWQEIRVARAAIRWANSRHAPQEMPEGSGEPLPTRTSTLQSAGSTLAAHLRSRDPHGRLVVCVAVGADDLKVMLVRELMGHEVQVPAAWEGWPVETRVSGRMVMGTGEDER